MIEMERTKRKPKHTRDNIDAMIELSKKHKLKKASPRTTKSGHRVGMSDGLDMRRR
jgi:hypothetical protein